MSTKTWVGARELARIYGLNIKSVYNATYDGRLPHRKVKGLLQYNRHDIAAVVKRHRKMNWKEVKTPDTTTTKSVKTTKVKRPVGRPRKAGRDGLRTVELINRDGFNRLVVTGKGWFHRWLEAKEAGLVGVVELNDGTVRHIKSTNIRFTDTAT